MIKGEVGTSTFLVSFQNYFETVTCKVTSYSQVKVDQQ